MARGVAAGTGAFLAAHLLLYLVLEAAVDSYRAPPSLHVPIALLWWGMTIAALFLTARLARRGTRIAAVVVAFALMLFPLFLSSLLVTCTAGVVPISFHSPDDPCV